MVLYLLLHELPLASDLKQTVQRGFLREIFHDDVTLDMKQMIIYIVGSIYIIISMSLVISTILIVRNDQLLRRGNIILETLFKGLGQLFIIINYVLFIPSLVIFAEVERCQSTPKKPNYYYTCLDNTHFSGIIFTVVSALFCIIIVLYTNLFINSQFPNKKIPHACWNPKPRVISTIWKIIYIYHYDILDERYRLAFRIADFALLIYQFLIIKEQPRTYNKLVNLFELCYISTIMTMNFCIILQDLLVEDIYLELLPVIAINSFLISGVMITRQSRRNKLIISRDNRQSNLFHNETDMELYVSLLLQELQKLKSLDQGVEISSTPQVFTIISKHMEHCRQEGECICKKYEPEFDKKFSSIGSRRLTMRQSTSFSNLDYMFKKKIPIKISYDTKCAIFMAEIADCIDRFLEIHPKSVGLKLQKSFFNHVYMNSSYKALFVQLENSHQCSSFRGKIQIYHLKTKIQEEMLLSEASPFSMDITTCLKFESKRVLFEQKIIDLCMICEGFWNELTQNEHDYSVDKVHILVLEISKTIMKIKSIFSQLCQYNPQNVDVIQNYALIYRYILRDEFRFNDIINNLNQLKKTNKLEQIRELIPKFFDSDNYAMILVSGDVKDLGRIIKANRGVEYIFGYMPNELQGYKVNKVMPNLFAQVHDEFIQNFLRRGHSSFIDRNQNLLIQNKLHFLQMTLAYIKAMVDLKMGLMFVSFFKVPLKVPNNAEGNQYIKGKDAHYILCDSKYQIHGMSHNCMKNLGIPPTIISKSKSSIDSSSSLFTIDQFSPGISGPEYEFDLPKGMNFTFDTTIFKGDKYLAKEFHELTGRMRKYNIFISMKKYEFKLGTGNNMHELLLYTIEILSFQLSEAPITIPVDKTDDPSYSQYTGTTVSSVNSDELRTSKFKEFKTQVQELKIPSKIALLKKITIAFFVFLLAVFSLNYALCATQNQAYMSRVEVLDLLFELTDKVPSTSRYIRTCVNIANGFENNTNEVINGDRFSYYMKRINDNSEVFRNLQQNIYTKYKSKLTSLDDIKVEVKDLQTDFTIKIIDSTISSAINMFSSKALQFSKRTIRDLANLTIPYISFDYMDDDKSKNSLTDLQQDLYFMLQNGHESLPSGLISLNSQSQQKIQDQSYTFMMVSLVIGIVSIFVNFIIIPIVFPLLVHYERLAYYILHALNKLTKKFVENEVKCCNQLFNYIGKKQGSGVNDKQGGVMMKKPEERKENKQLMRVNPKISKYVLEQEKRKKRRGGKRSGRSNRRSQGFEEDKINVESLESNDHTRFNEDDEGSGLLDEDDLTRQSRHQRSNHGGRQTRSNGAALARNNRSRGRRPTRMAAQSQMMVGLDHRTNGTASVASIDESTIQASVEMRSSTNKSSGDDTTSDNNHEDSYSEEEGNESSSSSQSNYTHYTNVSQWKALKQNGYSNANGGNLGGIKSNASFTYDITHAKSSELPAGDNYQERENIRDNDLSEEEKEFKRQIRDRQQKIRLFLKRRKCRKVLFLIILVIVISIYLGVNTMYTRFVYEFEDHLQQDINIIDQRILCYPYTMTLLKEMISRNQTIQGWDIKVKDKGDNQDYINRAQILTCYEDEDQFNNVMLGKYTVNGQQVLMDEYQQIQNSLDKNQLCKTLYQQSNPQKYDLCVKSYHGINQLGLKQILSFILRESEKITIEYENAKTSRTKLIEILKSSSISEMETIKDIFIDDALQYQRELMIDDIKTYASQLFRMFDILFSAFVAFCFIMIILGVIYFIKKLQKSDQELQKKGEELFNQTTDSQKLNFYNDVDNIFLKQQKPQFDHQQQIMNKQIPNKNDVVIYNSTAPDFNQWGNQNKQTNISYSLNQCRYIQFYGILASLFNDSKFVPFDQMQGLPSNNINNQQQQQLTTISGIEIDPKLQTASFNLPSNSIQLSLDHFSKGTVNPLNQLPPQTLPGTLYIPQVPQLSELPPQIDQQQQPLLQNHLIIQYEQVMQLMHQEIQKLLIQNKELQSQQQQYQSQQPSNLLQMQMTMREKDELIETLREREQVIMQLRIDNDLLNQNLLENANSQQQYKNLSEQQLKNKNDQLMERIRKLEKQLREGEQQNFELEQMCRNLKRDYKHQNIINDQMKQEVEEINRKREQLDNMVQETKNKLSQCIIQGRQMQSVIDQQLIEITNLMNIKNQQDKFLEIANSECERLRDQLNESEGIKLGQFQILERKEREIQNLRALIRRFAGLIQTHREEFGDIEDINYDALFKDVSNTNVSFQLPQTPYLHLQNNNNFNRQVKFETGDLGQPIKTKLNKYNAENDDYYGMVDKLAQYVRDTTSSHQSSANPSSRIRSPNRNQSGHDLDSFPKSILKNTGSSNNNYSHNQSFHEEPQPSSTPTISWLSSGQQNQAQPTSQKQQLPQAKGRGKSPDKKPNIEGLRATLSSLIEEKSQLERQLKSGNSMKPMDDLKFEIDLATNNIKRIQEKIQAAQQNN